MNVTAAQVRQALALLRWRSPKLARNPGIGFDTTLKAHDDERIAAVNLLDLRAI